MRRGGSLNFLLSSLKNHNNISEPKLSMYTHVDVHVKLHHTVGLKTKEME